MKKKKRLKTLQLNKHVTAKLNTTQISGGAVTYSEVYSCYIMVCQNYSEWCSLFNCEDKTYMGRSCFTKEASILN